jgi:hypothetical protein
MDFSVARPSGGSTMSEMSFARLLIGPPPAGRNPRPHLL